MADRRADLVALAAGAATVQVARDGVRVSGPDAVGFLQGQLSQEIAGLAVGESAWSFLLQPQGKVDALVRVSRVAEDELLLDVDAGVGPAVTARLQRFKIRVKAELSEETILSTVVPGGEAPSRGLPFVVSAWQPGFDVLEPWSDPSRPAVGAEAFEVLRIERGWPAMGAELTDKTIPGETGLIERTVSFTKGCYTGQELVARIDSRGGNVPRHLRGLVVDGSVVPPAGAAIDVGGVAAGAVTSAAYSPVRDAVVALAYVKRDVEPPSAAVVRWDGQEATARIEVLPLPS